MRPIHKTRRVIQLVGLMGLTLFPLVSFPQELTGNNNPPVHNTILIDDLPADIPHRERIPLMLWRAEKEGRAVYMTGSFHMAPPDFYPLPSLITETFLAAKVIVFEVEPETMNESFQKKLQEAGQLPAGLNLRKMLSRDARNKLNAALARVDAPENSVDRMKPWMAALVLSFSEAMRTPGPVSINHGIDRHFINESRQLKKKTIGLERLDDQLLLLSSLTDEISKEFLSKTLDELDQIGPLLLQMTHAWKAGDADSLWNIIRKSFESYPEVYQQWLVARNKAWIDNIEQLVEKKPGAFIVVGAAHLVGPDSLPEMLRARGYEVQQMYQDN